jgi:hypothetical protein
MPCRRRGCSWGAGQGSCGPVVTHRGSWVGVAGGDLDVPQVHAGIEHGRDKCMAEHVRVCLGGSHSGGLGEPPQAAGGGVAVHPGAAAVEQDRPTAMAACRLVDGPADRGRQWNQDDLGALATHAQYPVAVFFAEVGDVGAGGFEDPQPP